MKYNYLLEKYFLLLKQMFYAYLFIFTILIIGFLLSFIGEVEESSTIPVNFEEIEDINNMTQFPLNEEQINQYMSSKSNIKHNNKKIAIVSLSIGNRDFAKISKSRLQQYADLHGYTLEYYHDIINDNYAIMWQKTLAMIETLNKKENGEYKYDVVFWLDDDIYITNTSYSVENFMSLTDKDIILSRDSPISDMNLYLNSGTYIVKNTELGRKFMNDIIDNYDMFNGYFHEKLYHEQSIMIYLYLTKYRNDCEVLPFNVMQSFVTGNCIWPKVSKKGKCLCHRKWKYKDFTIHFAGVERNRRKLLMEKLAKKDDYLDKDGVKYPITDEFWEDNL